MSAQATTRCPHPSDPDEDSRRECKYGTSCYRKNPEHFKQFRHPHLEHNKNEKQRHQDEDEQQHEDEDEDEDRDRDQDQDQDQDHVQPDSQEDTHEESQDEQDEESQGEQDEESQDEQDEDSQRETSERITRILEQLSQCDVPVLVASWPQIRPSLINTISSATSIYLLPLATLITDYCEHSTKSCWRPIAKKQTNVPITQSKIGGRPFLQPDEQWPCCSVCSSAMPLWLQLNLSELPVEAALEFGSPDEMIQLFVCYTDNGCGTASEESDGTPTHLARKITWNTTQGQPTIGIPKLAGSCDGYDIPERVITGWKEMKDQVGANDDWFPVYETITWADDVDDEAKPLEGDKLLGFPQFFNDAIYPSCPICAVPPREDFTCEDCCEGVMNHRWTCTHQACRDIHLCQSCYDQKPQLGQHRSTHPMTRHDIPPFTNEGRMRYIFQIDAAANNVITPFDLNGCWHIYQCARHKDQLRACYVNS